MSTMIYRTESRWDRSRGVIEGGTSLSGAYFIWGETWAVPYRIAEVLGIGPSGFDYGLIAAMRADGALGPRRSFTRAQGQRGAATLWDEYEIISEEWRERIIAAHAAIARADVAERLRSAAHWLACEEVVKSTTIATGEGYAQRTAVAQVAAKRRILEEAERAASAAGLDTAAIIAAARVTGKHDGEWRLRRAAEMSAARQA